LERFRQIPKETDLTYAITHPVFRKEPWVLDMDCELPYLLMGRERHFDRFKGVLKRALASQYCKKIICWVDAGRKAFLQMGYEELEDKIEVVHWAVPKRNFAKEPRGNRIKLLFVNSANLNQAFHFENKGGKEVVEAFLELNKRYDNLELVMRSGTSSEMKNKCSKISNIRIIDKPIPWAELEWEWKLADIFVQPAHITPAMVFLDAMSYELPIVTTDVWANPELVEDGKTGFLVPKSEVAQYIDGFIVHFNSPEYKKVVTTIDPKMMQALIEKLSILIENPELRREMGKAGRWEVEHGKFSIEKRNEKLKRIFDEATA
jgi:glycosyltransferase involved in cell wall biosynthesis